MRCAHRFGRSGGEFLARARLSTTTRLSGAHRGRARGGQAAGRYALGAAQLSGAHRGRAHGGQAAGRHVWALVGLAGDSTCRSARPARRGSPSLDRVSPARSSPAAMGQPTSAPRAGSVQVRASPLVSRLNSHGHGVGMPMGSSLEPFVIDAAVTVVTVTVWRLSLPAAGGQVAFSWLSSHGLRAGPFLSFYDQGGSPGRLPLLFCPQYTSSDSKSDYATDASQGVAGFSSLAFLQPFRGRLLLQNP
jgi:hypothetical protein